MLGSRRGAPLLERSVFLGASGLAAASERMVSGCSPWGIQRVAGTALARELCRGMKYRYRRRKGGSLPASFIVFVSLREGSAWRSPASRESAVFSTLVERVRGRASSSSSGRSGCFGSGEVTLGIGGRSSPPAYTHESS